MSMPDGNARAILATYSDWRPVKGRKVLQLVFEVPLEQQAEVLARLGAPLPDRQQWVGIAIVDRSVAEQPAASSGRSERAREQYRNKGEWQKAATRAVMLCKDPKFQEWIAPKPKGYALTPDELAERARNALCVAVGIESRADIGVEEDAYQRFIALETDWKIASGQLPQPR